MRRSDGPRVQGVQGVPRVPGIPWFALGMTLAVVAVNAAAGALAGRPSKPFRRELGLSTGHLLDGDAFRLFGSALLTHGGWVFWRSTALMAVILVLTERRLGTARTAAGFWVGHALTVLVVSLGLVLPVHRLGVPGGTTLYLTEDVGPSAGYFACLGLWLASLPADRRRQMALPLGLLLLATLGWHLRGWRDHPEALLADAAHLVAAGGGLAAGRLLGLHPPAGPTPAPAPAPTPAPGPTP